MRTIKVFSSIVMMLLVALILTPTASTQTAPSDGQRIISYIDAHSQEAVALLERVVNIESATLYQEGVRRTCKVFSAEF